MKMTLELAPLFKLTVTPGSAIDLGNTPIGRRFMVELLDVMIEGERINARKRQDVAAADWLLVTPDGTGLIDIRYTVETDDGALIYIHYQGRRNFTEVFDEKDAPVFIAPYFETGDERYSWLNKVQAIGKGVSFGDTRIYEVYEVK